MKYNKRKTNIRIKTLRTFAFISSFLLICLLIKINYTNSKCKDLNYAVNHYMTTGFLNKNKILMANSIKLLFSDENKAIVQIDGLYYKEPHERKTYKASLSRTSGNRWTLDDVSDISASDISK